MGAPARELGGEKGGKDVETVDEVKGQGREPF